MTATPSNTPGETSLNASTGLIVVDHGSRRAASNDALLELVRLLAGIAPYGIVEAAHMELAEPSIRTAFARCVARGARRIVVNPFFLLPGRHWSDDIPALAAEAAAEFPDVPYLVTAPLGLHPLLLEVIQTRIRDCLSHAAGESAACDVCRDERRCVFRQGKA